MPDNLLTRGGILNPASATGSSTGTVTSVNVSGGSTGLTTSGGPITGSGTITLAGTLAVASGGTGVTTSSGASSVVLRDASGNITTNVLFEGTTVVAAAGTITTLTAASTPYYIVTGSGGQTFKLPDATTLPVGAVFIFNNNQSSGTIVVQNNSSTTVTTFQSGAFGEIYLITNATAAGTWETHYQLPSNVSWSTNTLDWTGSITNATWNGVTVATNRGGTGVTTSTGSGANVLSTSPTLTTPVISGGTIDSAPIGSGTPSTGAFTTVDAFGSAANAVTLVGAATGGNVLIGVKTGSVGPNLGAVIGNVMGTGALMAQVPLSDYVLTAAVLSGGTGYTVGDILTVVGGTGTAASVRVTTVSSGVVTGVAVNSSGAYSVQPSLTPATTGGTGTSCTLTLTYSITGTARGTNAVDFSTIRAVASQVASGLEAVVGGGSQNTASGNRCTVSGGTANSATGSNSCVPGGTQNVADADSSVATGRGSRVHGLYGANIHASGFIATYGDAQSGTYVLRGRSTGGAAVRLTADGAAAGSANVINIPIKTNASGVLHISAIDTVTWNSASWSIPLKMGCAATAGTMAIVAGTFDFANVVGAVAASGNAVLTADTTNRGVNVTCTPPNSNTWDYVAAFRDSEAQ